MEKIKIIQIGICHEHAAGKFDSLKKLDDVFELVGYVDERSFCKTPCREPAMKHYEGYRALTLEEALNCPGLQATAVEVPNNDLVRVAMMCAERGLPMHLDKPAGVDLPLYKQLLDLCQAKKLPFQMGYMFRGNPAFRFCIRAVREKLLGEVFEITADMNHCYGGDSYREYIGKFPGGLMYVLGCHLIDFAVAALGCPENVTSSLRSAPGDPAAWHTNCLAVLEYPGALVSIRSCCKDVANTGGRAMKIAGTNGTIHFSPLERFDGKGVEVSLRLKEDRGGFPAGTHTLVFPPQRDRYEEQLRELARMIRGEAESPYSFEHDCLVHKVTLAASNLIQWR
ncbi:MAG: Gfo/Idh/MocA family oxidoreductase [Lentisphaeria bacterium]|nr:Gfo/Idh/MocA family oxidoreductase [Lentisphaeria bacterium]